MTSETSLIPELTKSDEISLLEARLLAAPFDIALHQLLADKKHAVADELGALAHLIAIKAIEARHSHGYKQSAEQLYMVATGYFMKGDYAIAERWYWLVLQLDAELAAAYQNLVVIHLHFGRNAQAEQCRARAYALQRVFIDPIISPIRQLLILCVGRTKGNIPYEVLLSGEKSQRIKYIIDYAQLAEDSQLPHYDLVFNAIGEPDVAAPLTQRLQQFVQKCQRPILNPPDKVARTQRHLLAELMSGIQSVATAPCCLIDSTPVSTETIAGHLAKQSIALPVLLRPLESHGGQGLTLCHNLIELTHQLANSSAAHYVTSFVDFKSSDGFYRKYRVIFVDKKPYPYHLAISPHWMVHYVSAEMESNPWKIAEEAKFLQHPEQVLGDLAWNALNQIAQRLGLDYAGIDFTLLENGQLFIFEANATMLVHRVNASGVLAHKNVFVQRIADAFEALQIRVMG